MTEAERGYKTHVELPLKDAPAWLSHIEITRENDEIVFQVVKTNGFAYGETRLSLDSFNAMADLLLTP